MNGSYNFSLVALSFAIAVLASYTAISLAGRVHTALKRVRWLWLPGGAIAMGTGIWSMHFVAMLAFHLPIAVNYDIFATLLSLLYAVIASGIALWLWSRPVSQPWLLLSGSICMGLAIAWMHYTGMAAMRLSAYLEYDLDLVILSVVLAIAASFVALWLAFQIQAEPSQGLGWKKLGSALIMGVGISGMHYTGMWATHFVPQAGLQVESSYTLNSALLASGTGIAALFVLSLTLLTSLFDQRLTMQQFRQQALQASEERFRTLIRDLPVGVLLLNPETEILVSNQAANKLLDLQEVGDKLMPKWMSSSTWHFWREDGTPFPDTEFPIQQAIAQRQSIRNVVGIDHPTQHQRHWLLMNTDPQIDQNGNVDRVVCTLSDITMQKQAEFALRQVAEQKQALARVMQQMRQTLDLEKIFETTTQELRKILECDRVAIYRFNSDWSGEFVCESVAEGWRLLVQEQKTLLKLTETAIGKPKCIIAGDHPDSMQNTYEDTYKDTYLQETEAEIYHQGIRYRAVSDISKAGLDVCYLQLLEHFQAKAYVIVPIFCGRQLWGLLATYQNTGPRQWQEAEIQLVTQIGMQFGVAVQQAELLAQTQQQARELQLAKEIADKANRAKSEFLANMTHELRTPLNAILGFTQIMSFDDALLPEHRQSVNIINSSGEHLLELIDDILEMSKIEAGQVILNENNFDLYRLLTNLEELFKLKANSKGINLTFACAANVPKTIRADENKLRQVLINLLSNAVKFTEQGSVSLTVSSSCSVLNHLPAEENHQTHNQTDNVSERSTIRFEVKDTGSGIAAEEMNKLFKAFGQTQSGLRAKQGTGLGLAISQKFVQLMGGEIAVDSVAGQGSLFAFEVQVSLAEMPQAMAVDPVCRRVIGLAPNQPTYRILVVEDQFANRLLLVQLLRSLGFEVREAENGQVALDLWEQWNPHLIWMDMRMPVMNGYETIQQIRISLQGQATVIIALTASAFEEQKQLLLQAGCDDFVRKPFVREEVLSKMNQHLGVQYIYAPDETIQQSQQATVAKEKSAAFDSAFQEFDQLKEMPSVWLDQLQSAAAQKDDLLILKLIEQIPEEYSLLAIAITDLVLNFQFEEIITLVGRC